MSCPVLALAYHGAAFAGWQRQSGQRTVQGELEAVLERFYGQYVGVSSAGRTDAGVHALGQVVSWLPPRPYPAEVLLRALGALFPPELRPLSCALLPPDFHPRRSARSRVYRYLLREGDALFWRDRALIVPPGLDWSAMSRAAALFVSRRDFAALGTAPRPGSSTVRRVIRCGVSPRPPLFVVEVEADAFLYRMVRRLVGCLTALGRGELDPAGIERLLDSTDRALAPPPAPAHGLYLHRVHYDDFAYVPDPGPGFADEPAG